MRHQRKIAPICREDKAFFEGFFEKYETFILFIARKYESSGIQAEDIQQEAVVRLMHHIPTLRTLSHNQTCAYISHTVKTTFLDLVREEKRHSYVSIDSVLEEMVGMEQNLIPDLFMRQEIQRLRKDLTAREWLALKGKYVFGYSQEELGNQLGIAPDSVRTFLHRVRLRSRKILEPEKVTGGGGDD